MRDQPIPDHQFGEVVGERLKSWIEENPKGRVCLPTGATVRPVYETLEPGLPSSDLTVFLLDEFGGLPQSDQGRCESMLRTQLIDRLDHPPRLHVPNVDSGDNDAACEAYQASLDEGGLDLAIVGLGSNGHVGMNEPGSERESCVRVVELAPSTSTNAVTYGASVVPTWGITLGIGDLLSARELWLVVSGSHKREILRKVLGGNVGSDLPASWLRSHPSFEIMTDHSAAGV